MTFTDHCVRSRPPEILKLPEPTDDSDYSGRTAFPRADGFAVELF